MSATEVLNDLRHAGIVLYAEGDQLRYRAPRGAITPELRASVQAHRSELLALLHTALVSEGTKVSESVPVTDEMAIQQSDEGFSSFSSFTHQDQSSPLSVTPLPGDAWKPESAMNVDREPAHDPVPDEAGRAALFGRLRARLRPALRRWSDEWLTSLVGWHLLIAFERGGSACFRSYLLPSLAQFNNDELAVLVDWPALAAVECNLWQSDPTAAGIISRGARHLAGWWNARRGAGGA